VRRERKGFTGMERLARSDLRELLLDNGVALLLHDGITCGFDQLTFARVFQRVEDETGRRVTRASVYDRLWGNQEEFQWEVLARLIEQAGSFDQRTRRRIQRILDEADRTTLDGRRTAVRSLCQLAVQQSVIEASRRQEYRLVMAAVGYIASTEQAGPAEPAGDGEPEPPHVRRVREALRTYLERETDLYLEVYNQIGAELGLRTRAPLELRQFALAIGALSDGIAMRLTYFPEYAAEVSVPPGPGDDGSGTWSLAGIGVDALVQSMLELDPDWSPPAPP
jgi:hypothetical protein